MNTRVRFGHVAMLLLSVVVGACDAGDSNSNGRGFGLTVCEDASAADVDIDVYPGAKPYKEKNQSSGATVGLNLPVVGIKVIAVSMETPDEPKRVAAFYRDALSKHGSVLDCSVASIDAKTASSATRDETLTCEVDDADHIVYKVGTKKNQRIVAIKPHGDGSRFSLVRLSIDTN